MLQLFSIVDLYIIGGLLGMGYSDSSYTTVCYDAELCFNTAVSYCGSKKLPQSPDEIRVSYTLYNRDTKDDGETIDDYSNLPYTKFKKDIETVILIHGYRSSKNASWISRLKYAMLEKGDCNVIVVDWSNGAAGSLFEYPRAARNTQIVGNEVAMFCIALRNSVGADLSKVHLIGFSLGAQVAGFAGQRFRFKTKKITLPRITGLDPAGPCFEGAPPSLALDKSDADFVDVIHTGCNPGGLGVKNPVGHADFYPSGCGIQPGCFFDFTACNHRRAALLFIDSIENDQTPIWGSKCTDYKTKTYNPCPGSHCTMLGYYSSPVAKEGMYCLETATRAPYGREAKTSNYWVF